MIWPRQPFLVTLVARKIDAALFNIDFLSRKGRWSRGIPRNISSANINYKFRNIFSRKPGAFIRPSAVDEWTQNMLSTETMCPMAYALYTLCSHKSSSFISMTSFRIHIHTSHASHRRNNTLSLTYWLSRAICEVKVRENVARNNSFVFVHLFMENLQFVQRATTIDGTSHTLTHDGWSCYGRTKYEIYLRQTTK